MDSRRWDIADWKKIDIYNGSNVDHHNILSDLYNQCSHILYNLGTRSNDWSDIGGGETNYQDNVVHIIQINRGFDEPIKITLVESKVLVMEAKPIESINDIRECRIFRVGSWIDHVLTLKPIVDQKAKQDYIESLRLAQEDQQNRFGRLE
jgi:hypothetical protein